MKELQDILNTWAAWRAKHFKTGYRFVTATEYKNHSELKDYRDKECVITTEEIVYSSGAQPGRKAKTVASLEFSNNGTVERSEEFKKAKEVKTEFTWQLTETLKLGVQVTAKASVPEVVEVGIQTSVELGLSSTQAVSISSTETWEVLVKIPVPPHTITTATMVIDTDSYDVKFHQDAVLKGHVAIWLNDKVKWSKSSKNEHNLYFLPIDSVLKEVIMNKLIDATGYAVRGSDSIAATAIGTFTGQECVAARTVVDDRPYGTPAPPPNPNAGRTVAEVDEPKQATTFK